MEFTLLFAALTAAAFGRLALIQVPQAARRRVSDLALGAAMSGLVVGRIGAMISDGVNPLTNLGTMAIIRAGVDTGFASLAALAFVVWSARRQLVLLDGLAPVALASLGGWHAGCLWRGTCLGTASELPWAFAQANSAVTRHPVEIYAAIGFVLAALVLAKVQFKPGVSTGVGLAAAAAIRLLTEPMRPSISGGPIGWYWAALLLAVGATLFALRR